MSHNVDVTYEWFSRMRSDGFIRWTRDMEISMDDWDLRSLDFYNLRFTFSNESDATAFKIKFGV